MEYKFRGKVIGTDKWVVGSYLKRYDSLGELSLIEVQDKETFEIETHHVYPETVGQFTGLKDVFNNEIYGGDILIGLRSEQRRDDPGFAVYSEVYEGRGGFETFSKSLRSAYTYDNNILHRFMWCSHGNHGGPDYYYQITDIEVVGNRYDNPDYRQNPLQRSSVTNTMKDPNVKTEEEVKEPAEQAPAPAPEAQPGSAEGETGE